MPNNPEISQRERRLVLENDRKVAEARRLSSYRAHAEANADLELGGRFAKVTSTTVVGASPINYPRQPLTSPSNQMAMTGPEAPLGYEINAMEVVGEPHEVAASERPRRQLRRL